MSVTTVVMPQLGESVVEGTVVRWLVKPGQRIGLDEALVEVATDKANTEIPSPMAGVVTELVAAEGAVVPVGGALAKLDDSAQAGASAAAPAKQQPAPTAASAGQAPAATAGNGGQRAADVEASPVARNVAQEHGLDLNKIPGSGAGGRITKADVLGYLEQGATQQPPPPSRGVIVTSSGTVAVASSQSDPPPAITAPPSYSEQPRQPQRTLPPPAAPQYGPGPIAMSLRAYRPPRYTPRDGDQVVPFDQRRRLIAEHMVYSKATSPHVPCTAEVDMTALSRRREEWKRAKETEGKAPSYLVGICRATVQALAEFPRMNAVVQDESLIMRKDINLGVAVETEKGLLVPVIRKANEKSLLGLARAIDDLAADSRATCSGRRSSTSRRWASCAWARSSSARWCGKWTARTRS